MSLGAALRTVNDALIQRKVGYVVIGGVAVSVVAKPRATRDVDVVILLSEEKLEALLIELASSGFSFDPARTFLKLQQGKPAKIHWSKKFSVDLRLARYAIDFSALEHAVSLPVFEVSELRVAAPEDLIVYKLARFSGVDRSDIQSMLDAWENLDWGRIRQQAFQLAEEADLPEILERLKVVETEFDT